MFKRGLWDPEVLEFHELSTARVPMEDKCCEIFDNSSI